MKLAFLFLVVPFALIELLIYQRMDLLVLAGLYFAVAMQADWSASRLLRGLGTTKNAGKETAEPETIELKVQRLETRKTSPVAAPDMDEDTTLRIEPARPKGLPKAPRFNGADHEVLGVSREAHTRTIVNAFRHWIKRFHPDKTPGVPAEIANARVQRLTSAREALLERRRRTA